MPNQPTLDADVVRLAKAIRQTESRGDFNAKGASGEFGAYQFMPDTWASTTKKYNLDAGDLSKENQNKAAYMSIKELKDQGYKPDQIAATWNMGPNALTKGWKDNVGVNKMGVKYDTPDYVRKVGGYYTALKNSDAPKDVTTSSTIGAEQYGSPDAAKKPSLLDRFRKATPVDVAEKITEVTGLAPTVDRTSTALAHAANVLNPRTGLDEKMRIRATLGKETTPIDAAKSGAMLALNVGAPEGGGAVGQSAKGLIGEKFAQRAATRSLHDALDVVAPKETAKTVKAALKAGRGQVTGFFREVGMSADKATEMAARAVQGLVKKGATAAENSNAVLKGIGDTAKSLRTQLQTMDVTPIVTQEELGSLMQKASAQIGENPTMVGNAGETAARIFTKFKSYLPAKGDITADSVLEARQKVDAWMKSIKGDKVFDPGTENAVSIALRAIRQGANDLVATKAPSVEVQQMLAKQSAMYDALENIAAKGIKEMGTTGPARLLSKHPILKEGLIKAAEYTGAGLGLGLIGGHVFGKKSE